MNMKFTGDKKLVAEMRRLAREFPNETIAAMYQEGLALQAEAQRRTPVEYGTLRASAFTTIAPSKTKVEVGFGADYAYWVHERTELRHVVGEAKFLINAFHARASGYLERLAGRVRRLVKARR